MCVCVYFFFGKRYSTLLIRTYLRVPDLYMTSLVTSPFILVKALSARFLYYNVAVFPFPVYALFFGSEKLYIVHTQVVCEGWGKGLISPSWRE